MLNQLDPKDRWHLERQKRFTSSVNYKLLPSGTNSMFSNGGLTYIQEKAIESMITYWEQPKLEFVEPLIWGKQYEANSFDAYVTATKNYNMRYFGSENPVFIPFNEYSGGSPDAIMGEGEKVIWGSELKCPYNSKNHYLYSQFKNQWDLKEKRIEYYTQCQDLIRITGADGWHFCSYDERFNDKNKRIKVIEILPDKKFIDNLTVRLAMAQEEKLKIIQRFYS